MQALATRPGYFAPRRAFADNFDFSDPVQLAGRALRGITARGQLWFPALLMLPLLYEVAFKQTLWVPTEHGPERMSLIPIWAPLWYTGVWLLFAAIIASVFLARGGMLPIGANLAMRRASVLGVGVIFGVELASRFASHHLPGGLSLNGWQEPAVWVAVAFAVVVVAARPPRAAVLVGLLFAGGLALRLVGLGAITPDAEYTDNLPAIAAALGRLTEGGSPYGFYAFANHSTSMAYLPLTFLAYLPAYLAGLDIRVTNIVLSLAEAAAVLVIIRAVRVPEPARSGLYLACAINYLLPLNLGHDLHNEFQMSDLALVAGVGLVVTSRFRLAAAVLGIALGAMPTGLFCAAAVLSYAARRLAPRELMSLLVLVACIAALPLLVFVALNPAVFMQAMSYEAGTQWGNVAGALETWPYSPLWYGLGGSLMYLQIGLFVALAVVAMLRVRTAIGAAQMGAVSYLVMLLSGPQSGSHVLAVVVPLVLVAEAARHGRLTPQRVRESVTVRKLASVAAVSAEPIRRLVVRFPRHSPALVGARANTCACRRTRRPPRSYAGWPLGSGAPGSPTPNRSANSSRSVGLRRSRADRIGSATGHGMARSGSSQATAR